MTHLVRTTISIDSGLLHRVKAAALGSGRTLSGVVNDALVVALERGPDDAGEHAVVLPTYGGRGLQPGVDLDDRDAVARLLGDEDVPGAPS